MSDGGPVVGGPPAEPGGGEDSIGRNTAAALGVRLISAVFAAVLSILLIRILKPEDYGTFALAVSVGVIALLFTELGISHSTSRFIAERRSDRPAVRSVMNTGFLLTLATGLLGAGALFALAGPIANAYDIPELAWPLRATAFAVFGQTFFGFFMNTSEALQRITPGLRVAFTQSSVELGASLALVIAGAGAAGAAWGRAAGFLAAGALGIFMLARMTGWRPQLRRPQSEHTQAIAGYAALMMVIEVSMTIFRRIDVLLIGGFLGPAAAGLFEAPLRITIMLQYFGSAIAAAVAPRISRGDGVEPDTGALIGATRLIILVQMVTVVPMVVWAHPLVDLLFGGSYQGSIETTRMLAPFVFLAGLGPLATIAVNYLGAARSRIPIAITAVVVNLVIDIILIPEIGIIAGAIGSTAAFLIYVPGHYLILRRELGMSLRPILLTLTRALIAASGMAGLMFVLGTDVLSISDWLIGLIGGTAIYVGLLFLLREITDSDVQRIRGALGQLRARLAS